jgi:mRNA interferase RelE/StbE
MYDITIDTAAQRQIKKLPQAVQTQIAPVIQSLALNPRASGVKKLKGLENLWRVRSGEYRIIYEIHDQRLIIVVVNVGHRREVYE